MGSRGAVPRTSAGGSRLTRKYIMRPSVKDADKKKFDVSCYMSEEEYGVVKLAAERACLSVSAWMRAVCLREARKEGGSE